MAGYVTDPTRQQIVAGSPAALNSNGPRSALRQKRES